MLQNMQGKHSPSPYLILNWPRNLHEEAFEKGTEEPELDFLLDSFDEVPTTDFDVDEDTVVLFIVAS